MQSSLASPTDREAQAEPPAGARQTSQDMDDFIYLISHDVRASVRALLELPQWIKEDLEESGVRINAQVANSIDLMNRHTGRLDRMLVDLLAFSRVGRLQTTQELDLNKAFDEVMEEISVPPGFEVIRSFSCDSIQMGERDLPILLHSLISNGIKHHDKESGYVVIETRREGAQVVITATDDGPGIEEKFQDRVFSPMTTLRPRDEVEGSGMGLAKVGKIAQVYGGSARIVPSSLDRGLRVEVRIASGRAS